jgi:hypothetical protein
MMVPSRRGIEIVKKDEMLIPHSLKCYLGGWVCYKDLVQHQCSEHIRLHMHVIRKLL